MRDLASNVFWNPTSLVKKIIGLSGGEASDKPEKLEGRRFSRTVRPNKHEQLSRHVYGNAVQSLEAIYMYFF